MRVSVTTREDAKGERVSFARRKGGSHVARACADGIVDWIVLTVKGVFVGNWVHFFGRGVGAFVFECIGCGVTPIVWMLQ